MSGANLGSLLSISLKEKDGKEFKEVKELPLGGVRLEDRVIVLHHHYLSEDERKLLFQGVNVLKFDAAVHGKETAARIMKQVRVLVLDISFVETDLWYRRQHNYIKDTNCTVVYLAKKGLHCNLEQELKNKYCVDHIKKVIDPTVNDIETLIAELLIPHIPGVSRGCLEALFSCSKTAIEYATKK